MTHLIVFLLAYYLVAYHKPLLKAYNNRKVVVERIRNSTNEERYFVGASMFMLALGFLLASL